MNRQQWNNMRLTSLDQSQPNKVNKSPDQIEVSKSISMLHDGGAGRLHLNVIKRGGGRLVDIIYTRHLRKPESFCNVEGQPTNHCIEERRQKELHQLPRNLASLYSKKVFTSILFNRSETLAEHFLPEAQYVFPMLYNYGMIFLLIIFVNYILSFGLVGL